MGATEMTAETLAALLAQARREGAHEMRAVAANEAHWSPTGEEARDAILRLPLPGDDAHAKGGP